MFNQIIDKINYAKTITELKDCIKGINEETKLTAVEKHAIFSLYKARVKSLRAQILQEAYRDNSKKLFWNLYTLLKHKDQEVRKKTIQIVYEVKNMLTPEEGDLLFSMYKTRNDVKDITSEVLGEEDEMITEPF